MAGMKSSNGRASRDASQPPWTQLSAEKRAEYIHRDVKKVIEESQAATKEIVDAAMKEFVEDYAAIKSKPMRDSVLRNLIEPRYLVDVEPSAQPAIPFLSEPAQPIATSSFLSMFLHIFGI
jgi:hypothetical protein